MDQQLIFLSSKTEEGTKELYLTVKHYGHTVLQLGLLYLEFLDIINIPQTYRWNISPGELRSVFFKSTGPNILERSVVKNSRALAGQAQVAAPYEFLSEQTSTRGSLLMRMN